MAFKEVKAVRQQEKTDISNVYNMGIGPELKYFQLPAYNDPNFLSSPLSHLWSYLKMRTEGDYNLAVQPYYNGGLGGTALENLPEAFYNIGGVLVSVPNSNYRVQEYGQNQALYIPLNSTYSGMTSGLTATTLYSSLVYSSDINQIDYTNVCSGTIADTVKSEPNYLYTNNLGIGFKYIPGKNPMMNPTDGVGTNYSYFDSGVMYMTTDSVYNTFSGATGSSTSWGYLYNTANKYANGARLISFSPDNTQYAGKGGYDRITAISFLNYGLIFIIDPEIVQAFDWSTVNGDPTSLTGGTFTTGQTIFNSADMDISEALTVQLVMEPGEWPASTNTSYIGTGQKDCGIATSVITLHNKQGDCLAVGKSDEALIKYVDNYLMIDLLLPLSDPIGDSLADTRGTSLWSGIGGI